MLDGAALSWPWSMPFVGILLTIALGPVAFPGLWSRHYGKFAAGWSAVTIAAVALYAGGATALDTLARAVLADYMSFIVLLFALYVVAGGILVTGNLRGTPGSNTGMLFAGVLLASLVGTTGAAMIVVRPLIRANEHRRHAVHVLVFAIFLIANIGGTITPLGNPPLFAGFLHGVDFFWTVQRLVPVTCFLVALVLAIFFAIDFWLYRREHPKGEPHSHDATVVRIRGWINVPLIVAIIAAIVMSAGHCLHIGRPGAGAAKPHARCDPPRDRPRFAHADPDRASPCQWLYLGADPGGGKAFCRHLHLHCAGARDVAGGRTRRVRVAARARV
jgi:Na+/H+ antiporter NhaD/arsenite permease-like protein